MPVHRVGPSEEIVAPPHRTQLGRVLVTIDDLAVLMTLLNESGKDDVKVEFDGGHFTEAEELRKLTDIELRSLRLKNSKVEVVLNKWEAFAVGEFREAEHIYRTWARPRQTHLKPHALAVSKSLLQVLMAIYILLIPYSIVILLVIPLNQISLLIFLSAIPMSVLVAYLIWRDLKRRSIYSAAVVIPLFLDEHRQTRASQTYPRRSWIVAAISAIIAALAVVAAIWIKLTSK